MLCCRDLCGVQVGSSESACMHAVAQVCCSCVCLTAARLSAVRRPCPLAQQYIGVTVKKPLQRFQLMNEICYTKVGCGYGGGQAACAWVCFAEAAA